MKWFRVLLLWAMVTASALAQVEKVEIAVKGLSCAFCAYGLEKKLKEVPGVAKVTIYVEKGMLVLESENGGSIALETIGLSITQAGFTPGDELRATLVGRVEPKGTDHVLRLKKPPEIFILKADLKANQLIGSIGDKTLTVRITGVVYRDHHEGHKNHPYSIAVEKYQVLP